MRKFVWLICLAIGCSACAPKQESGTEVGTTPPPQATAPQPPQQPTPPAQTAPTPTAPADTKAQSLPEGFPLPVMEGLAVKGTLATSTGDFSGNQVELAGSVPPAKIAEFYEAEFAKRGLQIRKTSMPSDKGEEILILGESEQVT
ncbi:MAG: hypothetical protein SNJ72_07940, partial [Fimbriimonadales bacterium]